MAFYESPRFPEAIAAGAVGGPKFATTVVATAGGAEQRNGLWTYPLHAWDVSQGMRYQVDMETLRAFFLAARGRLHGWRFKDLTDYRAAHAAGNGQGVVAGLTSTTFQLGKRYVSGGQTLDRKITKPVSGSFELKDSGATLTPTTDYTLNLSTGVVTTTAPRTAANLTWAGEFDVPMRFDTDHFRPTVEARHPSKGLLYRCEALPIVELRL